MLIDNQILNNYYCMSSTLDEAPNWSFSSTSKYRNNSYIYLGKAICKKCCAKRKHLNS
tara:strand:- start:36 stop:209 length:174 start_codon:yes stop_codon:yes gene_type:complete